MAWWTMFSPLKLSPIFQPSTRQSLRLWWVRNLIFSLAANGRRSLRGEFLSRTKFQSVRSCASPFFCPQAALLCLTESPTTKVKFVTQPPTCWARRLAVKESEGCTFQKDQCSNQKRCRKKSAMPAFLGGGIIGSLVNECSHLFKMQSAMHAFNLDVTVISAPKIPEFQTLRDEPKMHFTRLPHCLTQDCQHVMTKHRLSNGDNHRVIHVSG